MVRTSSSASVPRGSRADGSRFANLRGVRWRMDLGILPSSPDASVDDIRRVTADSRRRYAILRRQLLMDPKFHDDGSRSSDLIIDNPLSQNPDSMWGRFFHNAELEKLVDQDLSRLYPEESSYFQSQSCQAMLRRILLSWCLRHPGYGYRQGMHELMAPLIYVLHVDVQRLSHVRRMYEDQFNDEFDGMSFSKSDTMSKYGMRKNLNWDDEEGPQGSTEQRSNHGSAEVDPETRDIILLNDAYGTEGELGIVLSERFMEHDAYCMFDALMNGAHGIVAIADFFSPSPAPGSSSGLSPVIEASSALYRLLSAVDSSLHCHLVELGVEPQYFALRWLRVLFGREFSLQDLLVIWDEVFSSSNGESQLQDLSQVNFRILSCPRGAFIASLAVSMLLQLRSSLLATENATICLKRMLNFPEKVDLRKLIEKARSLQDLAMDLNTCSHLEMPTEMNGSGSTRKSSVRHARHYSISSGSASPATPHPPPDSYWEEKWRVLHKKSEELVQKGILNGSSSSQRKSTTSLLKTQSDMSPVKVVLEDKENFAAVRRRLFDDSPSTPPVDLKVGEEDARLVDCSAMINAEEACSSPASADNSSSLSTAASSASTGEDGHEKDENGPEKSNFTPRSSTSNEEEVIQLPGAVEKQVVEAAGEKKVAALPPSRFQWLWRLGRGGGESAAAEPGNIEVAVGSTSVKDIVLDSLSTGDSSTSRAEFRDKRMIGTLKNLGQAMLDNIQVLESAFQQDRGGQTAAMVALKELRKISHRLFEM